MVNSRENRGVPLKYVRTVILYIFKRNCCNNEFEYQAAVKAVFQNRVPSVIKSCPSFSEKQLDELLIDHYLTPAGLYVQPL